ncbi:MAG: WbqC family protein [Elusimicrobiota bacterium]|nr:WbqC family protein [Elusimicrobiota bacterium]
MKLGIMQPYFFPYIGYFQLMNAVDEFVVYDNIEFTKKGWINRNRVLVNGKDSYITLPLKKDSDFLHIRDRYLAGTWPLEKKKMLNRIAGSYRKAPLFGAVYPVIEKCLNSGETNLFKFILNSLVVVKEYLGIRTPLIVSSTAPIDHSLKAEGKVVAICKARKADAYLNPIGGLQLYSREGFKAEGIDLSFIKSAECPYAQYNNDFVPWLSIIDVMMFNSKEGITKMLGQYSQV